eukprot:CAMPEP_0173394508 /NCGR_PEP_ID=MMETSP1356-20130122/27819_1 /TAXON_ID=77927 ORGANISM="Hemiselmis virescens, Strain PCC157" /NCGR_SAMPLE_ID=MMETSP1356 /ASSEMBLY_ACC=CAM_ASM_000847 /LENGTH=39 /DNA_ID= /DNA_START= /DNA_END= /DNA_ORIENTATION=
MRLERTCAQRLDRTVYVEAAMCGAAAAPSKVRHAAPRAA